MILLLRNCSNYFYGRNTVQTITSRTRNAAAGYAIDKNESDYYYNIPTPLSSRFDESLRVDCRLKKKNNTAKRIIPMVIILIIIIF